MWEDKILYWAWRGQGVGSFPPTIKRIHYATIIGPGKYINGHNAGKPVESRLAIGVYDDDRNGTLSYKELNRDELASYEKHGAVVSL